MDSIAMLVYPRVYQTGIVAESYTIWRKKRSNGIIENAGISQQNLMFNQHDGAPQDSVQLPYKCLNSMVYGRYNYS